MRKHLNRSYSELYPESRLIDVFVPDQSNEKCILFIHGGGWTGGNRTMWHEVMERFCGIGYVCASASYRLVPHYRFPANVEDVRLALSWLGSNAREFGFNLAHIAVCGSSAGGHLAAMLATIGPSDSLGMSAELCSSSAQPAAAICLCSVLSVKAYEAEDPSVPRMLQEYIGCSEAHAPDKFREASPIERIAKGQPPFLLIVGDVDRVTPAGLHETMAECLTAANVPCELHILPGAAHGFGYGVQTPHQMEMLRLMDGFLGKYLA